MFIIILRGANIFDNNFFDDFLFLQLKIFWGIKYFAQIIYRLINICCEVVSGHFLCFKFYSSKKLGYYTEYRSRLQQHCVCKWSKVFLTLFSSINKCFKKLYNLKITDLFIIYIIISTNIFQRQIFENIFYELKKSRRYFSNFSI